MQYDDEATFAELESFLLQDDAAFGGSASKAINMSHKINTGMAKHAENDIVRSEKKSEKRCNNIGRDDRATSEQVLDPRTRLILFKLLANGFISEIDGCLSTGKEANVYYAKGIGADGNQQEYAVKIFKTSILVFKDRDKYVSGEYRFRNGYCKSNPRKMVKTWAEKEMRNLKRLQSAGIRCPVPHLLKQHVLIMDFLGKDGWCAPRLKEALLTMDQLEECYRVLCIDMRRMYHVCNLVHGDLSEYNILWHEERPIIIDVSQSVEHGHPFASEFLRKDVSNVTEFFSKRRVANVLSKTELFHFVVDKLLNDPEYTPPAATDIGALSSISTNNVINNSNSHCSTAEVTEETMKSYLQFLLDRSAMRKLQPCLKNLTLLADSFDTTATCNDSNNNYNKNEEDEENRQAVEEAVFMQAFIPSSLHDFSNPYAEADRLKSGQREPIFKAAMDSMLGITTTASNSNNIGVALSLC